MPTPNIVFFFCHSTLMFKAKHANYQPCHFN
jgi:hypothetical protein